MGIETMHEFRTPRYAAGHVGRSECLQPKPASHSFVRYKVIRRVVVALAVVAAFGSSASAQDVDAGRLEISGGYQLPQPLRVLGLQEWFVSVAAPLDDRISLVGEVAGASLRRAGSGQTFLIGLRRAWPGRRVTPFVQGLVGGASLARPLSRFGFVEGGTVELESFFGGYQVGGGIDVGITRRIAARLAANSVTLYSERLKLYGGSGDATRFRFVAGAVLKVPSPPEYQALDVPLVEVAGGYQGFTSLPRPPSPRGWFVSVGRPLNERVTVVGEVADAYFRDVTPMIFVDEEHYRTYLAGVRYAWPGQRVIPFVQALGGAGVFSSREEALYEEPPRTLAYSRRYVAHQFTGGLDLLIAKRIAARFAFSSLTLYEGFAGGNILRFSTGVAVGIGNR